MKGICICVSKNHNTFRMATVILLKSNFSLSRQANMPRKLITRKWLDACTSGKSKTTTEDNREDSHTIKLKNEKAYSRASKVIESIKNSSDSRSDVITKPKFSQDFLPVVESSTKENSVGTGLYIDEDLEGLNPQERKGLEDFRKEIKASLTPTKSEVYRNLLSTVKASNFTELGVRKVYFIIIIHYFYLRYSLLLIVPLMKSYLKIFDQKYLSLLPCRMPYGPEIFFFMFSTTTFIRPFLPSARVWTFLFKRNPVLERLLLICCRSSRISAETGTLSQALFLCPCKSWLIKFVPKSNF
jgi:hypothetical protein